MKNSLLLSIVFCLATFAVPVTAIAGLDFKESEGAFTFDTGALKGVLKGRGKSPGLTQVIDSRTGADWASSLGLFSIYRIFDQTARYGDARERESKSRCLPDGSAEYLWPADEKNPYILRAVYRWVDARSLDIEITVTAEKDLPDFEVFLSAYLKGTDHSYGYIGSDPARFMEASESEGTWHLFPRDAKAEAMVLDGRWKKPLHPVEWVIRPEFAGALGLRRDSGNGATALVMAHPKDCFAVSMPYGTESHHSLYLSLFGRTIKAGESDIAHARLVLGEELSNEEVIELYRSYLREIDKESAPKTED
jgi:hypothetical protein